MKKNLIKNAGRGLLDFHTHSTHSDGTRTPSELAADAKKIGVSALALTDHNVISGLEEFASACKENDIFYVPFGAEIYGELPKEILTPKDNGSPDLIMLGKNPKKGPIYSYQKILLNDIRERILPETIKGLESIGFKIPADALKKQYEELKAEFQVTPHIIHDFIRFGDNFEVFVRYMSDVEPKVAREELEKRTLKYLNKHVFAVGCPAYSKRIEGFSVEDAVDLTEAMNCTLFIAHPGGEYGWLRDEILNYFIEKGVKGIEVRNYFNTPEQNAKFDMLAKQHKLARSGGSDYHGPTGAFKLGINDKPRNQLPEDILEELWHNLPE